MLYSSKNCSIVLLGREEEIVSWNWVDKDVMWFEVGSLELWDQGYGGLVEQGETDGAEWGEEAGLKMESWWRLTEGATLH